MAGLPYGVGMSQQPPRRSVVRLALLAAAAVLVVIVGAAALGGAGVLDRVSGATAPGGTSAGTAVARHSAATPDDASGLSAVDVSALPPEAQRTLRLIAAGGPYPYARDGVVYQNRERILPSRASGYYHEYTVPTPHASDRGARRIVVGALGERYYTDDHYQSFRVMRGSP